MKCEAMEGRLRNCVTVKHVSACWRQRRHVTITLNIEAAKTSVTVVKALHTMWCLDQPQLGDRLSVLQIDETPILNRRITFLPLLDSANRPAINQGDVFMNQESCSTTNGRQDVDRPGLRSMEPTVTTAGVDKRSSPQHSAGRCRRDDGADERHSPPSTDGEQAAL